MRNCMVLIIYIGVKVTTPQGEQIVRAICPLASMDLPARAIVTNFKQYNGAFGCLYCKHPGIPKADNPRSRCWPLLDCVYDLRETSDILKCARNAVKSGSAVRYV